MLACLLQFVQYVVLINCAIIIKNAVFIVSLSKNVLLTIQQYKHQMLFIQMVRMP